VATSPWDPHAAAIGRLRASDADRDRAVDALQAAYARGLLTRGELGDRTSRVLAARTYADLVAATAVPPERPPPPRKHLRKAVAYGVGAIVVPPAVVAAFLTYYGGFIILCLLACAGLVLSGALMASYPPGTLPSAGHR
jgi:peptidoglycan/LPS O-acetylase OafA/YrhL